MTAIAFTIPDGAKQQKCYRNFANSIRTQASLSNCDQGLKKFMEFHSITSYDDLLKGDVREIEERIIQWLTEEKSITNNSKATYLHAVKHFYKMNRCNLAWDIIQRYLGEREPSNDDRPYTHHELLQMYNIANLREKMLLTLLVSTGLRRQAVSEIKRKHLEKTKFENYAIKIYRGTKSQYTAFCSIECAKWIDRYFFFRESQGEKCSPDTPLLREEFDMKDPIRARVPRKVSLHTVANMMESLATRAGIRTVTHLVQGQNKFRSAMRKEVMLTHGCRKYYNTIMAKAKVYPIYLEKTLGHSVGIQKHYLRASDDDLLQEYMKAEQFLTIDPSARQEVRIKELESKEQVLIQTLEKQNADYNNRLNQLEKAFQESIQRNPDKYIIEDEDLMDAFYPPSPEYFQALKDTEAWLETQCKKPLT